MEPVKYFEEEIKDKNRLFSQFVPEDKKFWEVDNYLEFLKQREKNILDHLNQIIKKCDGSVAYDKELLKKSEDEIDKTQTPAENLDKKRSLAAYRAQLKRKQENPEKHGEVTEELLENIKRLEKELQET